MSLNEDSKRLEQMLFDKYGKIALSAKETAAVLGVKEDSLKTDRANATGIPFTRRNNKEKGQPLYTVTSIVQTLVNNETKII